jgi:hypothetical protein
MTSDVEKFISQKTYSVIEAAVKFGLFASMTQLRRAIHNELKSLGLQKDIPNFGIYKDGKLTVKVRYFGIRRDTE